MLIELDFDNFIELKNILHLPMFYTEDVTRFGIYMFLEGQAFGTILTMDEMRRRFGASDKVMTIFRATYLGSARKIMSVNDGGGITAFNKFEIDVGELKSTLGEFLSEFRKITLTNTGGQGTPGYAMIPVQLGSGRMRRCMSCGNILLSGETSCPSCGSSRLTDKEADMDMAKFIGWDFSGTVKWMVNFLEKYKMSQITDVNSEQKEKIKNMLIEAITNGWTLSKLENDLAVVLDDEDKARMIARTEVIRAANEGALLHFKSQDVEKVRWLAVPSAPGGRTCDACLALNGKEFLMKDAEGRIPLHVFCRCAWQPVIAKA